MTRAEHEQTFLIDTASSDEKTLWVDIPSIGGTICLHVSGGTVRILAYPGEITDAPWFDAVADLTREPDPT